MSMRWLERPVAGPPGPQGDGESFSSPIHSPASTCRRRCSGVGCGMSMAASLPARMLAANPRARLLGRTGSPGVEVAEDKVSECLTYLFCTPEYYIYVHWASF